MNDDLHKNESLRPTPLEEEERKVEVSLRPTSLGEYVGQRQLKERVLLPPVFEFPASFRTLVKAQLVKGRFDGLAEVLSETGEVLGVGDGRANDDERTDDHRQLNGYAEPGKRGQVIDEVCQDWINGCSHLPLPNLLFDAGSSSSPTSATPEKYMHSTVYSF